MEQISILPTADGVPTLYSRRFSEIYHSRHGALTESRHVFIRHGLEFKMTEKEGEIRVGEIGLGSGLNAVLAFQVAMQQKAFVYYHSVEAFPLPAGILNDFAGMLPEDLRDFHHRLMELPSGLRHHPETNFRFSWSQDVWPADGIFEKLDVLFYDAFSPEKQPELWTTESFRLAFESMNPGGILVTYCAKGYVRRNMVEAGFSVERLPGPPGKREMLRAKKNL